MKILFDTNGVIDFFRHPDKIESFGTRARRQLIFMSSVFIMELAAGCRTTVQIRSLQEFLKPFERADRIIVPDLETFRESGQVLAKFGSAAVGIATRRQISNDVLIAVSAAKAGLVVVTANARDLSRIDGHTPMRCMLPED